MRRSAPRVSVASMTGRIAVGYALLACLAVALVLALGDGVPWAHPRPWPLLQELGTSARIALSIASGLVGAALVILTTRLCVARFPWAQRLHLDLRPLAHGLFGWQVVLIASCSGLGEELLFRGLFQPWLGLLPTSVLFGLLHQVPGHARLVWVTWATTVGLLFGAIFAATGSLLGPILAHALVNAVNLRFLRDHDPLIAQTATETAGPADPAGNGI